MIDLVVAVIAAFLLGSIPFALLVGFTRGVDIRTVGSKNPGATNLGRALGFRYFLIAFILDALKGAAPTLAWGFYADLIPITPAELTSGKSLGWLAVVIAPVLGHMFSPWIGFKGGKGVATGLGALLGVWPFLTIPGLGAFVVFIATLAVWRYVGLSSSLAAGSLPLWTWYFFGLLSYQAAERGATELDTPTRPEIVSWPFLGITGLLAVFVIAKHRGNLERILRGSEPRLGGARSDDEIKATPSENR